VSGAGGGESPGFPGAPPRPAPPLPAPPRPARPLVDAPRPAAPAGPRHPARVPAAPAAVEVPFPGRRVRLPPLLPVKVAGHQQYVMTLQHGRVLDRAVTEALLDGTLHREAGVAPPTAADLAGVA